MSFIDLVKERYSVRSFDEKKVEKESLFQRPFFITGFNIEEPKIPPCILGSFVLKFNLVSIQGLYKSST